MGPVHLGVQMRQEKSHIFKGETARLARHARTSARMPAARTNMRACMHAHTIAYLLHGSAVRVESKFIKTLIHVCHELGVGHALVDKRTRALLLKQLPTPCHYACGREGVCKEVRAGRVEGVCAGNCVGRVCAFAR